MPHRARRGPGTRGPPSEPASTPAPDAGRAPPRARPRGPRDPTATRRPAAPRRSGRPPTPRRGAVAERPGRCCRPRARAGVRVPPPPPPPLGVAVDRPDVGASSVAASTRRAGSTDGSVPSGTPTSSKSSRSNSVLCGLADETAGPGTAAAAASAGPGGSHDGRGWAPDARAADVEVDRSRIAPHSRRSWQRSTRTPASSSRGYHRRVSTHTHRGCSRASSSRTVSARASGATTAIGSVPASGSMRTMRSPSPAPTTICTRPFSRAPTTVSAGTATMDPWMTG